MATSSRAPFVVGANDDDDDDDDDADEDEDALKRTPRTP